MKKYTGVYYDEKKGTYYVNTKAKNIDGIYIGISKRGFVSEAKAYKWKNEEIQRIQNSGQKICESIKLNFENLIEKYYAYRKAKGLMCTTIYAEKIRIEKQIVPFFRGMKVGNISNAKIQDFQISINNLKIMNKSKNQYISSMLNIVNYLALFNYVRQEKANDWKKILTPFSEKNEEKIGCKGVLNVDQFKDLLNTYDESELKYKLLIKTIFCTGTRNGEARAILVKNVNFIDSTITIDGKISNKTGSGKFERLVGTKTNSGRTERISTTLANELYKWIIDNKLQPNDFLFFGQNGKNTPISENALRKNTLKHFKLADIEHIRIHDLRHSLVCNLIDAGVDVKAVSEMVGHKNVAITQNVYNHVTEKKRTKLDNTIESLL